jgi:hypothetical protein
VYECTPKCIEVLNTLLNALSIHDLRADQMGSAKLQSIGDASARRGLREEGLERDGEEEKCLFAAVIPGRATGPTERISNCPMTHLPSLGITGATTTRKTIRVPLF